MIGIATKSKEALKVFIGTDISPFIIETSMFGKEYTGNDTRLPFVYPSPYNRKGFGQITTKDRILVKVT